MCLGGLSKNPEHLPFCPATAFEQEITEQTEMQKTEIQKVPVLRVVAAAINFSFQSLFSPFPPVESSLPKFSNALMFVSLN